ncbi:DNA polymerase III subunit delta' [Glaciimonas sp. Gout2]|uniref:DNA polymerase III subunit delta' n=1 Tax=unclassified Glaciimonas TaxID=2644401 RepID=UPI002B225E11|nr:MULTISPECIES: DNA polymerase III subunit delta' [unclassified Glaciimonas]MEB0010006.1 DNA polymerase III subunit delta' [Glaciimonas sp. Cout2]MEB0081879.1 DNA polymerase III subunit delta' [Glaciimonas sp. Gout2]
MSNLIFPWQSNAWQQLQAMRARMPHAILFHGAEGIGKTIFAEQFAQSLFCDAPLADGHACGVCPSCGWFVQHNHPDYRRVRPEILEDEDARDVGDGADDGGDSKKTAKSTKAPSKEIKIDQIRALAGFMNISTHRQGQRVVVLYPAEALNAAAANALLKTLEEPPPNTVFLLISNSLDRLLPTILSRCRKFPMPVPSRQEALLWLQQQGVADADMWLAEQGGAPLTAQIQSQSEGRELINELLAYLSAPGIDGALKCAERLQKTPVVELLGWQQRWLYDLFSLKMTNTVRYYPRHQKALVTLAARTQTGDLLRGLKACNERRAIAEHPLSARLFIEDMLLDYAKIFA